MNNPAQKGLPNSSRGPIRLAAVGDLLLPVDPNNKIPPRDISRVFSGSAEFFKQYDVVLGNLECTLDGGCGTVATEPRVISSPELISGIQAAGFTIVTLANNHAFDCLQEGFHRTRKLLEQMDIAYFGAGDNLEEAEQPLILDVKGIRLGFLSAVDRGTGPNQFAAPGQCGVVPLELSRLVNQIRQLRKQVDHVIVSVHWGSERFSIPSPAQIEQGHKMAEAGASLVLGHHPHVLQGMETWRGAMILYSLGNFVSSEVYFTDGDRVRWNRTERTGCILTVEMDCQKILSVNQIPTYDTGERIEIDGGRFGRHRIRRVNACLKKGVTLRRYRREYLLVSVIRPIISYFRWSRLKTLGFRQIKNGFIRIFRVKKIK